MIQVFCNNKMKKILAIGLSVTILFVALSPIRSAFAAEVYTIGTPYTLDGQTKSDDYGGINDYYDLLLYAFWESWGNILLEEGYTVPTVSQCDTFLSSFLGNYKTYWRAHGFEPDILCNIYVHNIGHINLENGIPITFDFLNTSDMVWSPNQIIFDYNTQTCSFSYSNATIFTPLRPDGSYYYISKRSVNNSVSFGYPTGVNSSDTVSQFPLKDSAYLYIRYVTPSLQFISSSSFGFVEPNQYLRSSTSSGAPAGVPGFVYSGGSIDSRLSCLVSSFPYYVVTPILDNGYFVPWVNRVNNDIGGFATDRTLNPDTTVFYPVISDHIVYSKFSFSLYATPTPYPTVLPSISPTPLPVGYNVDIDGMNDGTTLGFLQGMFDSFQNISSSFVGLSWIATTIGYLFHYCPPFAFLLFIPLVAFLSFILGRNKS